MRTDLIIRSWSNGILPLPLPDTRNNLQTKFARLYITHFFHMVYTWVTFLLKTFNWLWFFIITRRIMSIKQNNLGTHLMSPWSERSPKIPDPPQWSPSDHWVRHIDFQKTLMETISETCVKYSVSEEPNITTNKTVLCSY